MKNIVLNIPHSSTVMPGDSLSRWSDGIDVHIVEHCDLLSDKIFSTKISDINSVIYKYSRFYCDVERLLDDQLEEVGQGIYYTDYCGIKRGDDDFEEVMSEYHKYIEELKSHINEDTIVIDCHTFSNDIDSDVDVCIGFNDDETKPNDEFLANVKDLFESHGYRVSFNKPFSNSISPYTGFKYKSMMIELNKKLYLMDKMDATSEKHDSYKLNALINYLFKKILNEWTFKD